MQHDDNLHIGAAPTNIGATVAGGRGFGPIARFYVYDLIPAALSSTSIASSQSPGAQALTLTASGGNTATQTSSGINVVQLDCPRAVTISSGGNDSGIQFSISGYDVYGSPMTQLLTGSNGGTAITAKAFYQVASIVPTGSVASTVTAGTADVFGLPIAVLDAGYIAHAGWANVLTANAGTFVAAVQTPATNLTGDVRGTYAQSGASSNGTNRLVLCVALSGLNIGGPSNGATRYGLPVSQTVTGVLGVTQA